MVKSSLGIGLLVLAFVAPAAGQSVEVGVGGSTVLHLDRPAAQVVLGDPTIADISMQSPSRITVMGRKAGGTKLSVYDRKGVPLIEGPVIVRAGENDVVVLYMGGKDAPPGGREAVYTCGERCVKVAAPQNQPAGAPGAAGP